MKKLRFLPVLLWLGAFSALAQMPGDMASDPHYHLLLKNDQVRVFAVALQPGEQAFVLHEHGFLMVTPQDEEVVIWSAGESPIQNFHFAQGDVRFFLGDRTVGLRNDRTVEYRNLTVEFLNPKVTSYGYKTETGNWGYGSGGINPPVDPHAKFANHLELGAATVVDVQLLPGDALPPPDAGTAELLMPVTDVDLKQEELHLRKRSGDAVWVGAGRKTDWLNASGEPIRFTVVEFKPEAK